MRFYILPKKDDRHIIETTKIFFFPDKGLIIIKKKNLGSLYILEKKTWLEFAQYVIDSRIARIDMRYYILPKKRRQTHNRNYKDNFFPDKGLIIIFKKNADKKRTFFISFQFYPGL